MRTLHFTRELNSTEYNTAIRVLEAIGLYVEEKEDDTKMSKEEFYKMIEEAKKTPSYPYTEETRQQWFGDV